MASCFGFGGGGGRCAEERLELGCYVECHAVLSSEERSSDKESRVLSQPPFLLLVLLLDSHFSLSRTETDDHKPSTLNLSVRSCSSFSSSFGFRLPQPPLFPLSLQSSPSHPSGLTLAASQTLGITFPTSRLSSKSEYCDPPVFSSSPITLFRLLRPSTPSELPCTSRPTTHDFLDSLYPLRSSRGRQGPSRSPFSRTAVMNPLVEQEYYGQPVEDVDVGLAYHKGERLTAQILSSSPLSSDSKLTSRTLTVKRLLPPVPATDIRGLGLQYFVSPKPDVPLLFFKPQSALVGPGDEIFIPRIATGEKVDYEVELCVVIGRDCKDVSEEEAISYVAGYTVANDITSRGLSVKGVQWGMAKGFDSTLLSFSFPSSRLDLLVLLPSLATHRTRPRIPFFARQRPSRPRDHHDLERQSRPVGFDQGLSDQAGASTALLDSVSPSFLTSSRLEFVYLAQPELISRLSHGSTLRAGSLILTGSPMAIGRKAPGDLVESSPFLQHCDEVRCYVEGIGSSPSFLVVLSIVVTDAVRVAGTLVNSLREEGKTASPGHVKAKL